MTNEQLIEHIKQSGYKLNYLAYKLNISYRSLHRKLRGQQAWSEGEKEKLIELVADKFIQGGNGCGR